MNIIIQSRAQLFDREKSIKNVGCNQFNLVLLDAARAREIERGFKAKGTVNHLDCTMTALLEIQEGKFGDGFCES